MTCACGARATLRVGARAFCALVPPAVSVPAHEDSPGSTVGGIGEALFRAIELSLERSDHATQSFCRSNQHRVVNCFAATGGKQFLSLGHPSSSHGASCPCVEMSNGCANSLCRATSGKYTAKRARSEVIAARNLPVISFPR